MILGLGTDLTAVARWEGMIERHGAERVAGRILHPDEARMILEGSPRRVAERLAGRWALREAFGKALGTGMSGWRWRELRFDPPRLRAEGELAELLAARGVRSLHATLSHEGGLALAVVVLEG